MNQSKLLMPRDEIQARLSQQIEHGETLLENAASPDFLDRYYDWNDTNAAILKTSFSDRAVLIAYEKQTEPFKSRFRPGSALEVSDIARQQLAFRVSNLRELCEAVGNG
jgi:hypothetical protein